eukprot:SAG31_NODE_43298_length_267_cov_1.535714_1_plen_47_part_10
MDPSDDDANCESGSLEQAIITGESTHGSHATKFNYKIILLIYINDFH